MLTRLQVERYGPLFLGLLTATLTWWRGGSLSPETAGQLLPSLLSAAAITAGFMTTALSVLLPIGGTAIGRRLKRRNKFDLLFSYLRAAVYSCVVLAVICVVGLFRVDPVLGLDKLSTGALVTIAVYSTATFIRILEILIQILPQLAEPEDKNG